MPSFARNVPLLALFQVARMSLFPVAIMPLYMTDHCGLSVADVMWLQSLFGLVIALSEFPSGYVADRIGYRRTLLVGSLCVGAGWSVYPFAHDFWTLFVGELVLAVGFACVSGCDSALLYESLHAEGHSERFGKAFARQQSFGQMAEGTAALGAGVLFALHATVPFFLQIGVSGVMFAAALRLREPEREAAQREGSHLRQAFDSVADALRGQPRLRRLLLLWTLLALAAYLPVWLFAPYAREAGVPVAWLGPLWALGRYFVALGSLGSETLRRRLGVVRACYVAVLAVAFGYGGLSLSHALLGCTFYFAICWMQGLGMTLLAPHEQALIPSRDRAALISFRSMLFRASFFVIGPLAGMLVDREGFHATFALFGSVWVAATALAVPAALGAAARRRDASSAAPLPS